MSNLNLLSKAMTTDNKGAMTDEQVRVALLAGGLVCGEHNTHLIADAIRALLAAQPAQAVGKAVEDAAFERYNVVSAGSGFWPFAVTAGNGTQHLFVGHRKACDNVARRLTTAFLDGAHAQATLGVIAPVPAEVATTCCRKNPCLHPGKGPCDLPAAPEPIHAPVPAKGAEPVAQYGEDCIFTLRKQPNGERWPVGTKLYVDLPVHAGDAPTYMSTQATNCAQCGERKHTPLRIDWMGGYVCLTCIDKELEDRDPEVDDAVPVHAATIAVEDWGNTLDWTEKGCALKTGTKLYYLPTDAVKGEAS